MSGEGLKAITYTDAFLKLINEDLEEIKGLLRELIEKEEEK